MVPWTLRAGGLTTTQPKAEPLTAEERKRAGNTQVYVVWCNYDYDDSFGEEQTRGLPLAICLTERMAQEELSRRKDQPPPAGVMRGVEVTGHRYEAHGPWNLLAVFEYNDHAILGPDEVLEILRRAEAGESGALALHAQGSYAAAGLLGQMQSLPLTSEERERAAKIQVWCVWYEDQFHAGSARDSFPVKVCLSQEEAEKSLKRGYKPLTPGWDGHTVKGPFSLAQFGPDTVREILGLAGAAPDPPQKSADAKPSFLKRLFQRRK